MRIYSFLPRLYRSLGILTGDEAASLEEEARLAYEKINTLPENADGKLQKHTIEHKLKSNVGEKMWFRQLLPLALIFAKREVIRQTYAPIINPLQNPQGVPQQPVYYQNGQAVPPQPVAQPGMYDWLNK